MIDVKGFLSDKEAKKLQELFLNVHHLGSVLEIGTYCGKSTLNFGLIAKKIGGLIYTVDHHTGSEEHQLGEEYHDEDLYDDRIGRFNTLPEFLKNIKSSNLFNYVIPIINNSKEASKTFFESIGLLFDQHSTCVTLISHCLATLFVLVPKLKLTWAFAPLSGPMSRRGSKFMKKENWKIRGQIEEMGTYQCKYVALNFHHK